MVLYPPKTHSRDFTGYVIVVVLAFAGVAETVFVLRDLKYKELNIIRIQGGSKSIIYKK